MSVRRAGKLVVKGISVDVAKGYREACDSAFQSYSLVMESLMIGFLNDQIRINLPPVGMRRKHLKPIVKVALRINPDVWARFTEKVGKGNIDYACELLMKKKVKAYLRKTSGLTIQTEPKEEVVGKPSHDG